MRIQQLRLTNFRNYADLDLAPGEGLNVFVGQNAQGKSNLLEALYVLATTRSLRASRESEMIRQSAETAVVAAEVIREKEPDVALELSVFQTDKKSVRINGVRRTRMLELLGQLNAVFFGALDLGIVSSDPSVRRRWLNLEISQISPKYCFDLAAFKKVLEQRNRLLRDLRERPYRDSGLEVWNEQLVHYGAPLLEKRRFFLDRLAPLAAEIHSDLTDGKEALAVRYLPSVPINGDGAEEIANAFHAEIQRLSADELRRGVTLTGPQRDDAQFLINGVDARTFGSQGQQRTVVLSLKLAEFRLMEDYVGEPPILLLDDVMSDLDDARREHLLCYIRRRSQTFVTCTNLRSFPEDVVKEASVFRVESGIVTTESGPRNMEDPVPAGAAGAANEA
jgi:DNA replication and repair protein RecF